MWSAVFAEVYPRVCGGTVIFDGPLDREKGLSPRVRGNRPPTPPLDWIIGSIPACAGEPSVAVWSAVFAEVYPRVCGGTGLPHRRSTGSSGLSPRVRGNPVIAAGIITYAGSIPACAGEPSGA